MSHQPEVPNSKGCITAERIGASNDTRPKSGPGGDIGALVICRGRRRASATAAGAPAARGPAVRRSGY